eukprot:scaffold919_cov96-Skeletonema_dohrnii-CCMP3373.AAC.9
MKFSVYAMRSITFKPMLRVVLKRWEEEIKMNFSSTWKNETKNRENIRLRSEMECLENANNDKIAEFLHTAAFVNLIL